MGEKPYTGRNLKLLRPSSMSQQELANSMCISRAGLSRMEQDSRHYSAYEYQSHLMSVRNAIAARFVRDLTKIIQADLDYRDVTKAMDGESDES